MSAGPVRLQVSSPAFFLRLLLFWLAIYLSFRILFLAFNPGIVFQARPTEILLSLVAGLRLDLSTAAYFMLPMFICWALYSWSGKNAFRRFISYLHFILLPAVILLFVGNIKMYPIWGALLTHGALAYLRHPGEVLSFISFGELAGLILFIALYLFAVIWAFKKWVIAKSIRIPTLIPRILLTFSLPGLLILFGRGGWQLSPINESSAYFSSTPFFNHVAINPIWYFVHSYLNKDPDKNLYHYMPEDVAVQRNAHLYAEPGTITPAVLTSTRPNIVIILLESWTADIIQALGGETNVTPFFDSLQREGILFTRIYAAGPRTEHGLISVLSGFPPPPRISIINMPGKSQKLRGIHPALVAEGYSSSFYYGGDIGFANMKSFVLGSGFQMIHDKYSFSENEIGTKWGAHDEIVLAKQLADLNHQSQPFFSVVLTLSTHEPFEIPMETPFPKDSKANKFRAAAYYTDHCLGNYFREAARQPWYANTLFILVSDHGHLLPQNTKALLPKAKHIPLLFYGPVIKPEYQGRHIDLIGNQNDIAATLLKQLELPSDGTPRSKDLLNPGTRPFAYYVTNDALGWVTPDQSLVYTFVTQSVWKSDSMTMKIMRDDSLLMDAKAYLQTHFKAYLGM